MKYRKIGKYKYTLHENEGLCDLPEQFKGYEYHSDYIDLKDCVLTAKKGYAWNGVSKPAINTETNRMGSLWHDVGYQLIRHGVLPMEFKHFFDLELKRICLLYGMWKIRAEWTYQAVDKFGVGACKLSKEKYEDYEKVYTLKSLQNYHE